MSLLHVLSRFDILCLASNSRNQSSTANSLLGTILSLYTAVLCCQNASSTGVAEPLQGLRLCACLQVAPKQSGSLVYKIDPLAPAHDVLKENDVVMEIDKVPIADDGTVEFRNEERVEFSHIVRAKHIGMTALLRHTLTHTLHRARKIAPSRIFDSA